MKQVGKGVWLARKKTHESIEATPLNSVVFPIDSSINRKIIRKTPSLLSEVEWGGLLS
jgi:hypothetical protein